MVDNLADAGRVMLRCDVSENIVNQKLSMAYDVILPFAIGPIGINITDDKLVKVSFLDVSSQKHLGKQSLLWRIQSEFSAYFQQGSHHFNLPVKLIGTPLQQKVWRALQQIPPGQTISYSDLAQKLQTSPRVIGNACRANSLPIIFPCHRVVAKNGLGGFSGYRSGHLLAIKSWLLRHEGAIC